VGRGAEGGGRGVEGLVRRRVEPERLEGPALAQLKVAQQVQVGAERGSTQARAESRQRCCATG